MAEPYIPPNGSKIPLTFTGIYTAPNGSKIPLEFVRGGGPAGENQYVFPPGISPTVFGTHVAWRYLQYVSPQVGDLSAYGTPSVRHSYRYVQPVGWDSQSIPRPRLINNTLQVFVGGIAPPAQTEPLNGNRQVPHPWVSFYRRNITPEGKEFTGYGTPLISHYVRFVDVINRGIAPGLFGDAFIRTRTTYVNLIGFVATRWGDTTVKKQFIVQPKGWHSSDFSSNAELLVNTRKIHAHSGLEDQAGYGIAEVKNRWSIIDVNRGGIDSLEIRSPVEKVFNLKQQITVAPYSENIDPTGWANFYPFVENKIRRVAPSGHVDSRFPLNHWVRNKGAPVFPIGEETTLWGSGTFVAHKVRYVSPQGFDSFYTTNYAIIYNDAHVIAPPTLGDTSKFGKPDPVLNLNRTIKHHSGWVGPVFGEPFVAFGVRYITPRPFNDVPWPLHEVRLNPHPLKPAGIPPQGQVGGHDLRLYKATISPFSINVHPMPLIGEPIVENHNKTVPTFGHDSAEFGRADVQNYTRYVAPQWVVKTQWGNTLIERRTKNVSPPPLSTPAIPTKHRIYNTMPDPPSVQRILLTKWDADGNEMATGFGIPPGSFGPVRTRLATIYGRGFVNLSNFGTHRIWTNNIRPSTIFEDGLFGTPSLNHPIFIYPEGFKVMGDESRIPRPSMSPHNIYAPRGDETPDGYTPTRQNRHVIDGTRSAGSGNSSFPWFGQADVQHFNRNIAAKSKPSSVDFGEAKLTLRKQYIQPLGARFTRFGLPVFWGVPQYVSLDEENNHFGIDSLGMGRPAVGFWQDPNAPRYIRPVGSVLTLWGNNRVELLHRTITATGIPHRGNPQESLTSPWGRPLVGYPRRYEISMGETTLWGEATIEYLNREIHTEGWINCSLEDGNFENFRYPMKVTRTNPTVRFGGIESTFAAGRHSVSHYERTIIGRGIDSLVSGRPTVRTTSTVVPQGWLSSVFGNIDRWEYGVLKPHGDDMSTVSIPVILHPIRPPGFDSMDIAVPSVANSINPIGIPPQIVFGPTVTNPFGCTNRVVTTLPVVSTLQVSVPSIESTP